MKKRTLVLSIMAGISFLILLVFFIMVLVNDRNPFDIDITVRDSFYEFRGEKYNFIYWFFRIITELGFTYFIVSLIAIILIVTKARIEALTIGLSAGIAFIFNKLIQLIVQRPRPEESLRWMTETSTSFPSGHSNTSTAFYLVIGIILFFYFNKSLYKILSLVGAFSIIGLVIVSRLVLGVHYFTDVTAGFFEGVFMASVILLAHFKLKDNGFNTIKSLFAKKNAQ